MGALVIKPKKLKDCKWFLTNAQWLFSLSKIYKARKNNVGNSPEPQKRRKGKIQHNKAWIHSKLTDTKKQNSRKCVHNQTTEHTGTMTKQPKNTKQKQNGGQNWAENLGWGTRTARNASIPQKRRKGGRIEMVAQGWWTGEEKNENELGMDQRVEKHRHTIWKKIDDTETQDFLKFIPPPKTQKKYHHDLPPILHFWHFSTPHSKQLYLQFIS